MELGIVVTDDRFLSQVGALFDAAAQRGCVPLCFLTDTGVRLLNDPGFVARAQAHPNRITLCEHSVERLGAENFDLQALADVVVVGGQYQDAELVRSCDKVLVF